MFIARFDSAYQKQMILSPVLSIKHIDVSLPAADRFDAIIITSANAISPISKEEFYTKPVFCVGKKTAEQLRNVGFSKIEEIADTVEALLPMLKHSSYLRFFYPRGVHITQDLSNMDKQIKEEVVYEAVEEKQLSEEAIKSIEGGNVQSVMFFSRRSAEVFAKLVDKHDLSQEIKGIKALCMSEGVLECVHTNMTVDAYVSSKPNAKGMEDLVLSHLKKISI